MKKNMVMALVLMVFLGCSEKKSTPMHKKHLDLAQKETKSGEAVAEKPMVEEFIPDHVRKSKIEVVKRY